MTLINIVEEDKIGDNKYKSIKKMEIKKLKF